MPIRDLYNANAAAENDSRHFAEKVNDNVLFTEFSHNGKFVQKAYFDFLSETVSLLVNTSNNDRTLTFAEMDPKVLQLHRDILIELGGRPQPLSASVLKPALSVPVAERPQHVNNDLLRPSSDPEIWKLCAAEMNGVMATIDFESARRLPSATLTERDAQTQRDLAIDAPRKLVGQMQQMQWGGNRTHFTYGQLDTEALVLLAERKIINWQEIFNAKASFGKPDDLERIRTQALLSGATININSALAHASKPANMVAGLRFDGNYATTEYLFRQGADPNMDNNGVLFYTVVEQGRSDIGRLFAKFGQNGLLNVEMWVNKAKADRKIKLHEDLRKIHWEYGRYHVLDNETLQETKIFPDNGGSLKILFNFASRHVTEMLELPNPKQVIVKDYSFDDYGQQALESARAKMIDMGANPSGIDLPLRGKSVVPKPATFGLPGKPTTP